MSEIILKFDLPYPLRVEGRYVARIGAESLFVDLLTHYEEDPRFPGAEMLIASSPGDIVFRDSFFH